MPTLIALPIEQGTKIRIKLDETVRRANEVLDPETKKFAGWAELPDGATGVVMENIRTARELRAVQTAVVVRLDKPVALAYIGKMKDPLTGKPVEVVRYNTVRWLGMPRKMDVPAALYAEAREEADRLGKKSKGRFRTYGVPVAQLQIIEDPKPEEARAYDTIRALPLLVGSDQGIVLIVGYTNAPAHIDSAIVRPGGRFERRIMDNPLALGSGDDGGMLVDESDLVPDEDIDGEIDRNLS